MCTSGSVGYMGVGWMGGVPIPPIPPSKPNDGGGGSISPHQIRLAGSPAKCPEFILIYTNTSRTQSFDTGLRTLFHFSGKVCKSLRVATGPPKPLKSPKCP